MKEPFEIRQPVACPQLSRTPHSYEADGSTQATRDGPPNRTSEPRSRTNDASFAW